MQSQNSGSESDNQPLPYCESKTKYPIAQVTDRVTTSANTGPGVSRCRATTGRLVLQEPYLSEMPLLLLKAVNSLSTSKRTLALTRVGDNYPRGQICSVILAWPTHRGSFRSGSGCVYPSADVDIRPTQQAMTSSLD